MEMSTNANKDNSIHVLFRRYLTRELILLNKSIFHKAHKDGIIAIFI